MLRRPGIGTPGSDDRPRDLKLCFLFRADEVAAQGDLVGEMIADVVKGASRERRSDGGIRDRRVETFTVAGRPGTREPLETWFEASPGRTRFSVHTTEGFADKLLAAVRKWGTRTYYLDLQALKIEDWSQRRLENTRVLLDRAMDLALFEPVLLQGEFIPEAELLAEMEAWREQVVAAHRANLAALRVKHPGCWALLTPASYTDKHGVHGLPGTTVLGIYASEVEVEQAAQDYWHLCYLLNIDTGAHWSRWAAR